MDWEGIFKGVQLCIGFQLLIVAVLKLKSDLFRNRILGFFALRISISAFSVVYFSYTQQYPWLLLLFGGGWNLIHSPLIYVYIRSLNGIQKSIYIHFILPITYLLFKAICY